MFVKSRYARYSSVSDMLDGVGMAASFSKETQGSTHMFYTIINGLAQGALIEAYKDTRKKDGSRGNRNRSDGVVYGGCCCCSP